MVTTTASSMRGFERRLIVQTGRVSEMAAEDPTGANPIRLRIPDSCASKISGQLRPRPPGTTLGPDRSRRRCASSLLDPAAVVERLSLGCASGSPQLCLRLASA
jgi:hypothetical protein